MNGTVTKLTDYGAFIEIEEGIEGLAHISEFSWVTQGEATPRRCSRSATCVECMILGYDLQAGQGVPRPQAGPREPLGRRSTSATPWACASPARS
ncbi:MAG: S1 RNA-binding domain-containing protein [Bacillus subtilis]|nr:S1 RNA-binding domain-containing protein [Bacillus subtilis]